MDLATAAQWLPDLFALLCDEIEPHLQTIVSSAWSMQRYEEEEALQRALREGTTTAASWAVLGYLQGGRAPSGGSPQIPAKDVLQRKFLVARCIDDVLGDLRPGYRVRKLSPQLKPIREHFVRHGYYHRGAAGLVIPRGPLSPFAAAAPDPSEPRPVQSGDRLDQLFRHALRVPAAEQHAAAYEVVFERLPARDDFPSDLDPRALRFAVVPWGEGPDAVVFRSLLMNGEPRLDCSVPAEPADALRDRARALVERLDAERVAVALLPELVLSPAAIDAIRAELKALRAAGTDSALRMVIAGSCLSEAVHETSKLSFNECVVLGARGQVLWRQRKLNHYAMATKRMTDYGLGAHVVPAHEGVDHKEHTQTCRVVQVRDGRLGRMLVLICEDLAQPRPGDRVLEAYRPDWVFSPVLDGEIEAGRWIHRAAWPNAARFGVNGLVATSLVLPARCAPTKMNVGVGLCVAAAAPGRANVLCVDRTHPPPLVAWTTWDPLGWKNTWIEQK
jgi:predicted amidohydrolase